MPQLNTIPEVLYEPNQPYHYLYDNIPLRNILARISLVNIQVDRNVAMLLGTAGSTGSLASRLNISLNDDGSLVSEAIDDAEHSIAHHVDGEKDGVEYVRMRADERAKLVLIDSGANNMKVRVDDTLFEEGELIFQNSPTISFSFENPNIVKAHSAFPTDSAHRHHYGMMPAHVISAGSSSSSAGPDWRSFMTTSLSTPYMEGSLRVYINGVRIGQGTYVPIFTTSSTPSSWMIFSVSEEDHELGTFSLNSSVPQPNNSIMIDFDTEAPILSSSSSS